MLLPSPSTSFYKVHLILPFFTSANQKKQMFATSSISLILLSLLFLSAPVWTLDEKEIAGLLSLIFNLDGLPAVGK